MSSKNNEEVDAINFAQLTEQERVESDVYFKHCQQIESLLPSSQVRYSGGSISGNTTTVTDLVITMVIDFPYGVDIDKQQ